ncbi:MULTISPECIES: prepilin peptidase [Bradyrhizobium]|uniref:Prepilin peptidase n=3 Tax=Bradyrhizobium TaxID=374 RepID=A0AAE5X8R8_9BRAD|nr:MULTISPECIES: A24 family peptidase [Bradyrhizobium]MCG2628159.1 A24 family peptidase [Bradyrhizobium zhengyangense]MCG2643278.1 A24 family peptidase [Bradyrhizobium zhengyangense]MCG2670408.1 A24 family peptidase [Bradyrhizobium zhengyangense]MDN4985857.1 A24 family peptidase [Bradyrhizobium sp. WYCCWR 13022]MDN5002764.1 A24 family peptidase [Bradyrhizobium sp. WYCCWR 12677]
MPERLSRCSQKFLTFRAPTHVTVTAAFVLCAVCMATSVAADPSSAGLLGAAFSAVAIAIAVIDARLFVIPDELTILALVLGLANVFVQPPDWMVPTLATAASRGAALAAMFWLLRIAYRSVRLRDGIGLGDVKLAGVAGVWLDWNLIPIAIEVAAGSALIACGIAALLRRDSIQAITRLPFGLFFAPAIWVTWLIWKVW